MKNSNGAAEVQKRIAMAFETGRNPQSIKTVCRTIQKNKLSSQNEVLESYNNSNNISLAYSIHSPIPPYMPAILPNLFKEVPISSFRLNKSSTISKIGDNISQINPFESSLSEIPISTS